MEKIFFTKPGSYDELINHINVHKYYINQDQDGEIPFEKAAKSWFDNVYMPIRKEIQLRSLLQDYPDRTVGDMYLWIVRNWDDLKRDKGEDAPLSDAVGNFRKTKKKLPFFKRIIASIQRKKNY